jgi:uncharacterized protein YgiM (DUF1202 family)
VRTGPGTQYPIIFRLVMGDTATMLETRDQWYRIRVEDGRMGWAHKGLFEDMVVSKVVEEPAAQASAEETVASEADASAAETADAAEATVTVKVQRGRVRAAPSTASGVQFSLERGETATLSETRGEWYLIKLADGRSGWAHKSLFFDPVAAAPVAPETAPETSGAEIKEIRYLATPEGDEKIFFMLSREIIPEASTRDGENPMVICDFSETRLGEGMERRIDVNGIHVQQIRVEDEDQDDKRLRVILELVPDKNYFVEPVFYKSQLVYGLTFRSKQ